MSFNSINSINSALTPVMQSHFDQIIRAKDRNDGVTEGELFAGVAYHAIIDQSGTAAGREYLKMVNEERAKGAGLFTAAKVALNKMGKFFAKTMFKSKKDAAKLGEDLEREIRKTASACAQLDGKAGVSNRKESAKDLTEAYQTAAGAYSMRGDMEEPGVTPPPGVVDIPPPDDQNGPGVIDSNGGGTVPEGPSEISMLESAIVKLDDEIKKKIAALDPEDETAYRLALGDIQMLQDARKAVRELQSNVVKARGEALMTIARNIR